MGQNIGTCITAIISSIGVNSNARKVEVYKQNIDELIFKARNKHIQNIQYGKLPMEFDYLILNLFTDLDRISEHCMNVCLMFLRDEKGNIKSEFVYAW